MLTIFGSKRGDFCDGVSRRNFIKIGALGIGGATAGLSLPQLLQAESAAGVKRSQKAVIVVYLPGGPSHQDMWDLKPEAPSEFRGEFKPIKTNAGFEICEHFPNLAKMGDKFAVIRSLVNSVGDHSSFQCLTGRNRKVMPPGGWPAIGSCLSKLQGAADPAVPPNVSLSGMDSSARGAGSGFLGVAHAAFTPSGKGKADMVLNGVSLDRLGDRKSLLTSVDKFRRDADNSGAMEGLDSFNREAMEMITSSKLLDALDVKKEAPDVLARYHPTGLEKSGEGRSSLESFCVARRLVEAGARCVTLSWGGWDTHGENFKSLSKRLPALDVGLSALIGDLHDRGLSKDVSVVVWGEFGRTPKVNDKAGRDHWPKVTGAFVAGGGMKLGQAIGRTDRIAGEVVDRPIQFSEVFSTLYYNLGIDTSKATVQDLSGRPQYLVEGAASAIRELV